MRYECGRSGEGAGAVASARGERSAQRTRLQRFNALEIRHSTPGNRANLRVRSPRYDA